MFLAACPQGEDVLVFLNAETAQPEDDFIDRRRCSFHWRNCLLLVLFHKCSLFDVLQLMEPNSLSVFQDLFFCCCSFFFTFDRRGNGTTLPEISFTLLDFRLCHDLDDVRSYTRPAALSDDLVDA